MRYGNIFKSMVSAYGISFFSISYCIDYGKVTPAIPAGRRRLAKMFDFYYWLCMGCGYIKSDTEKRFEIIPFPCPRCGRSHNWFLRRRYYGNKNTRMGSN